MPKISQALFQSDNELWFLKVFFHNTVTEKFWDGKWTRETRSTSYDASGCRVETVIAESSDYPAVTKSVTVYDFLGRAVSVTTPQGVTSNFYDGASDRVIRVSRTGSPDTLYEYEAGSAGVPARTALDVDGDGAIGRDGPDRITSCERSCKNSFDRAVKKKCCSSNVLWNKSDKRCCDEN